ncbi:cation diffusion facilitator family transporter [Pseudoalteromonas fenneropenaei]|uniref:Cation diffusion facilitator family transporter n=1 Tax=Pseudoalteromonas fenneropenaei TaxID=1737459 RepID=A0ABV7CQG5_9GAMM
MNDITTHEASRRRLLLALAITCSFMVIQLIGAYYSNSLAVLADAGHLFVHNSSLFIAVIASAFAVRLAKNFNEGYKRAEYTGGLINGVLYLSISLFILYEGGGRLAAHHDGQDFAVNSYLMSMIAAIGFLFHGLSAWILYKGRKDSINVYAVFLHSFLDLLSTISTFIAGVILHLTGWQLIDVISSMLISLFVLYTGVNVVRLCIKGLFFTPPVLPDVPVIEKAIVAAEHVESVHNVTVSYLQKQITIGAHIVLKHHCTLAQHDDLCRVAVERQLTKQFGKVRLVLQVESHNCPAHPNPII